MEKTHNLNQEIKIPRTFVIGCVLAIYTLAFILTPYWLVAQSNNLNLLILGATVILGGLWANISSGTPTLRLRPNSFFIILVTLTLLIPLNLRQLLSVIPWRGDESAHIQVSLFLFELIQPLWALVFVLALIVFLALAWKCPKWAGVFYTACLLILLPGLLNHKIFPQVPETAEVILRYPFVNYWPNAILLVFINLFRDPYSEIFYRLPPFLASVLIVAFATKEYFSRNIPLALLTGLAIATIPLLFYYSSILYLELPAVFLMLVVCLRIKNLLLADFDEIKNDPAWYALILIGFIKETALPFLLIFLFFRLGLTALRFTRWAPTSEKHPWLAPGNTLQPLLKLAYAEFQVAFSVLFPIIFYILLRSSLISTRSLGLQPQNFWQLSTYLVLGRSFLEQFGLFQLIFLVGCLRLIQKKEVIPALFFLTLFLGIPLFHSLDDWQYIGYSRFNLFMLPAILGGSAAFLDDLIGWNKTGSTSKRTILPGLVLVVLIASNLWVSPINLDGTKKPLWGNYNVDTSEHYYPYKDALLWLRQAKLKGPYFITGMPRTHYFYNFYLEHWQWSPDIKESYSNQYPDEASNLGYALNYAKEKEYRVIIYQVIGKVLPVRPPEISAYPQQQVFCNQAHCLIIFY
ncbi:MAG: hypothetical protein WCK35_13260 [Chloroflexota bacterium]